MYSRLFCAICLCVDVPVFCSACGVLYVLWGLPYSGKDWHMGGRGPLAPPLVRLFRSGIHRISEEHNGVHLLFYEIYSLAHGEYSATHAKLNIKVMSVIVNVAFL